MKTLQALILDPDPAAPGRIDGLLDRGVRVAARRSTADVLDYVARAKPDVVLLGAAFWREGWEARIRAASPRTVVLPVAA